MAFDDRTQPEPDSLARADDFLTGDLSLDERLAVGAALAASTTSTRHTHPDPNPATPLD